MLAVILLGSFLWEPNKIYKGENLEFKIDQSIMNNIEISEVNYRIYKKIKKGDDNVRL